LADLTNLKRQTCHTPLERMRTG